MCLAHSIGAASDFLARRDWELGKRCAMLAQFFIRSSKTCSITNEVAATFLFAFDGPVQTRSASAGDSPVDVETRRTELRDMARRDGWNPRRAGTVKLAASDATTEGATPVNWA